MELEEKVLHIGLLISIAGLFMPWLSGGSYGESELWANGFDFRTGFIGHFAFLISLYLIAITVSPLVGGPVIVRRSHRSTLRFLLCLLTTILLIAAFTVLLRMTFENSGTEVRFGIYVSIVGSALSTMYALLKYQEFKRSQVQELFRHPEDVPPPRPKPEPEGQHLPPPPPPPPPPPAEDHHLFTSK
jgi:MFS family permease